MQQKCLRLAKHQVFYVDTSEGSCICLISQRTQIIAAKIHRRRPCCVPDTVHLNLQKPGLPVTQHHLACDAIQSHKESQSCSPDGQQDPCNPGKQNSHVCQWPMLSLLLRPACLAYLALIYKSRTLDMTSIKVFHFRTQEVLATPTQTAEAMASKGPGLATPLARWKTGLQKAGHMWQQEYCIPSQ